MSFSSTRDGRRYRPYGFTEHGAIMAASVLNSPRAIEVSVYVVRAFVKLREMLRTHKELARKLAELEKRMEGHGEEITALFGAIHQLMEPPESRQSELAFTTRSISVRFGRQTEWAEVLETGSSDGF